MPHILALIDHLHPAIPCAWQTLVLVDRGLWSPSLWQHLTQRRLHPLVRIADGIQVRPAGFKRRRTPAELVPKQGQAWVGQADVFGDEARQVGTLLIVWGKGHKERWVLLTDLPPRAVQHSWYGVRMWIELGFRALKSMGWQWQKTRRTEPERVARFWLVLAVTTLCRSVARVPATQGRVGENSLNGRVMSGAPAAESGSTILRPDAQFHGVAYERTCLTLCNARYDGSGILRNDGPTHQDAKKNCPGPLGGSGQGVFMFCRECKRFALA